jgi:SAM-dependent methyltransferase
MVETVTGVADLLGLHAPGMELFQYSASHLRELYGAAYEADAIFIVQKLGEFARLYGETPPAALAIYRRWIEQAQAERLRGAGPRALPADADFRRHYLYALTLSTVLNRSRYELLRHYRRAVETHLPKGATILEIGTGNCLDAAIASRRGPVSAYERNELSLVWLRLLDLAGRVDLRLEDYGFAEPRRFDFVAMIELLEHVADPAAYLQGASRVLRDDGLAYLTFAVRMPQFDHLTDFGSIQECRDLLAGNGFAVREEQCLVDTYLPFAEEDRWRLGDDPRHAVVYCCLAHKDRGPESAAALQQFNGEIE